MPAIGVGYLNSKLIWSNEFIGSFININNRGALKINSHQTQLLFLLELMRYALKGSGHESALQTTQNLTFDSRTTCGYPTPL
jgi:hypothetical protein